MDGDTFRKILKQTFQYYNDNRSVLKRRVKRASDKDQSCIKEFKKIVFCDQYSEKLWIHVTASLQNGRLTLSGQDLGDVVEEFFDDIDYEYWYLLDKEGTQKLLEVIDGFDHPKEAVIREFGGTEGIQKFEDICKKNNILYGFYSYA